MLKRLLLSLSLLALTPLLACAEDAAWVEGTHYDVISPAIRTADPSKVEMAEFFWYGCGHCYSFEPMIGQWKKTMPDDVSFRGLPAMWGGPMELHARAYFAAQALGVSETMNAVLFQALNVDRKKLASEDELAEIFAANGVAEADFRKAYNSFGVSSQVRQAASAARAAKVTGTPSLMVNGKYLVTIRKAGGQANMLKVADYLVQKERAALGS